MRFLLVLVLALLAGCAAIAPEQPAAPVQAPPSTAVASLMQSARADADAGRLASAAASLERALRIAPNNVATRTNLGIALYVSGRIAEAQAQFQAALRILPDYAPALRSLALARASAARQGLN